MTISRSRLTLPATHLLVVLTLVLGFLGGVATTTAPPAQALVSASTAYRALQFGASKNGARYLWGGVGPSRFDCSGLTQWAYAKAGKRLPRTAAQQYSATARLSKAHLRRGDLVFFLERGKVTHMGIYAGSNRIWHATKTAGRVKLSVIWTTAARYGRVR